MVKHKSNTFSVVLTITFCYGYCVFEYLNLIHHYMYVGFDIGHCHCNLGYPKFTVTRTGDCSDNTYTIICAWPTIYCESFNESFGGSRSNPTLKRPLLNLKKISKVCFLSILLSN